MSHPPTLFLLVLSAPPQALAVSGFTTAMSYAHAHAETHAALESPDEFAHPLEMSHVSLAGRAFGHLHHLYRPHHHHNHPPRRFHKGIEVEVSQTFLPS